MQRRPHAAAFIVRSMLASSLVAACGGGSATIASPVGTAAPAVAFSLPSNDGELFAVPVKSAKTTVVDFFGPTCAPCAKKVPELVGRRSEIERRGARLVLVAVLADGENSSDAEAALAKWGAPSSFLVDSGGVSLREAGVKDLPSTLVLDAEGHVRWRAPIGATAADVVGAIPIP